jgi:hypothetical protein
MSRFAPHAVSFAFARQLDFDAASPRWIMFLAEPLTCATTAVPEDPAMEPFQRTVWDAASAMRHRNTLLAQPDFFFQNVFGGRMPTLQEKLCWIEDRVRDSATLVRYQNNLYTVVLEGTSPLIHACIKRLDGRPCTDWNHLQQIKNELIGPEHEAVDLFPAESRLINLTNEFHLWAHPTSGFRFPFGFFADRCVKADVRADQTPAISR